MLLLIPKVVIGFEFPTGSSVYLKTEKSEAGEFSEKEIIVFVYPEKGEVAYAINGESGENILNFIGWAMQQKNHKNGTFCFDRNVNYHEKLFEYFSL